MLPPVPPLKTPASPTSAGRPRGISSSSARNAKAKDDSEPKPGDVTASSGDAPIHAPTGGANPDPVPEEVAGAAPGLPIKERTGSAPIDVKIPKHRDPEEPAQTIVSTSCITACRISADESEAGRETCASQTRPRSARLWRVPLWQVPSVWTSLMAALMT